MHVTSSGDAPGGCALRSARLSVDHLPGTMLLAEPSLYTRRRAIQLVSKGGCLIFEG